MIDLYVFYGVAALTLVASLAVFAQKKLVHAVIALATAFLGSSLVFFLIGQTLVALLQLIVFVGGFSTYLIVAVATEEKSAKLMRFPVFIVLSILLFAGLVFTLQPLPQQSNQAGNFLGAAAQAFTSGYPVLYIIATLLFAATIGGVLIIKKITKLIV